MKKHILFITIFFAIPVLLYSVTGDEVSIARFSMKPLAFNERRDPVADSPYNAFDGDTRTASLYSDFSVEFSKPVNVDQIKIMNGDASNGDLFKKSNRLRDIEITLYTVPVKTEKKVSETKSKKVKTKKSDDKNPSIKDKDVKIKDSKDNKTPDKIEKDIKDKETDKKKTPEKIVNSYDSENTDDYLDNVKLYLTGSETIVEPENKAVSKDQKNKASENIKDSAKSENKKKLKGKTENKTEKNKIADKKKKDKIKTNKNVKNGSEKKKEKKTAAKKEKKTKSKTPDPRIVKSSELKKEKISDKNIIEITGLNKDKQKKNEVSSDSSKAGKEKLNIVQPEVQNKSVEVTEVKKEQSDKEGAAHVRPDDTAEKISFPEITEVEKKQNSDQKKNVTKSSSGKKTEKGKIGKKKGDKNRIEIVESKNKKDKTELPAADTKVSSGKKSEKSDTIKDKISDQKIKKDQIVKQKDENEKNPDKIVKEYVKVEKMKGIVKPLNDNDGRVLIYATLKDSADFQKIDMKGRYSVTKINFRTRDEEYYTGREPDRSVITEIQFFNKGKKIPVQGVDLFKKNYIERYNKTLSDSISGETFIMYENNDIALRMTFKKDGSMEFFDRFRCRKKGDADCTAASMPDRWRVADGRLLMRYNTLWRVWKYELDNQNDLLDEKNDLIEPPRWMKIYYRSENGFSDKYLDLVRSSNSLWAE